MFRDEEEGDGRFIPLIKIDRMPALLADGKLGDVFTSDMILRYIKQDEVAEDFSWLEDRVVYQTEKCFLKSRKEIKSFVE